MTRGQGRKVSSDQTNLHNTKTFSLVELVMNQEMEMFSFHSFENTKRRKYEAAKVPFPF